MTYEFTLTIKEILDKAGLDVSVEQIEAGLNAMGEEIPGEDPWPDEVIRKIEEERKEKGEPSGKGRSFKGKGRYYVMAAQVDLEYSGRAHKTYNGEAILLIKPDDSLVVHGPERREPGELHRPCEDIRLKGKDGKLTITAVTENDRLVMTFLKDDRFREPVREHATGERTVPFG